MSKNKGTLTLNVSLDIKVLVDDHNDVVEAIRDIQTCIEEMRGFASVEGYMSLPTSKVKL